MVFTMIKMHNRETRGFGGGVTYSWNHSLAKSREGQVGQEARAGSQTDRQGRGKGRERGRGRGGGVIIERGAQVYSLE
jgi:hypothetical protein